MHHDPSKFNRSLHYDDLHPDPPDDIDLPTEPDFDCEPESWKKCGACPTMIPNLGIGITKPGHRTLDGKELCSECTDLVTDAEQEAADTEAERRADERAWLAGGHA